MRDCSARNSSSSRLRRCSSSASWRARSRLPSNWARALSIFACNEAMIVWVRFASPRVSRRAASIRSRSSRVPLVRVSCSASWISFSAMMRLSWSSDSLAAMKSNSCCASFSRVAAMSSWFWRMRDSSSALRSSLKAMRPAAELRALRCSLRRWRSSASSPSKMRAAVRASVTASSLAGSCISSSVSRTSRPRIETVSSSRSAVSSTNFLWPRWVSSTRVSAASA